MVQSFRKNIKGVIGAFLIVIIASSVALQVQRQATLAAPIETKITASDGVSGDYFSWSVFIDGNYAIVGAPFDDDNGNDSGSAYIFKKTGGVWSQIKKLTASDGAAGDHFGQSVSIAGNYAIVGAPWDNSELGSAYMFKQDQGGADQWGQIKKLTASDGAAGDHFSESVAIDGDYAIVGAI